MHAPPPELVTASEVLGAISNAFDDCVRDDARVWIDVIDSPVGALIIGASRDAVCLLEFVDRASLRARLDSLQRRFSGSIGIGSNNCLTALRTQLEEYFAGTRHSFEVPLSYPGTPFQEKVWSALLSIPFGQTWSYLDLAQRLGDPGATRAVGMANGMNPIAILIPCHRVVNAGGELGGYGGGAWRKRMLLDLEHGQLQLLGNEGVSG
jgi:O-6-methylguanine DNA methyltransferase